MTTFVGDREGSGRRIAVVAARFNEIVTAKLVEGARSALAKHGVADDDVDVAWVPGAFEIPLVAACLARSRRYDAVVCLGAVIRGDTVHFELVANESARGIAQVSLDTGVPVIFEVLATTDMAQAEARAGGSHGNKGWEAAEAALEMAWLMDQLPAMEQT
ncbi:MAG: 6,7-dimethyl-8-ribityllumazine synthase [Actinomycetota bacterium]|nr:6,7-dimethyl-8-ribityllumazine synthase [Actinomycetota bacterium]MDH5223989.1 6,7-dimethyl-8-ribityllumazine synthase [Actinomycetota bacterium]MDH5314277.1 6,7-dimethyl-8-ribityllumazine synthase [Actinomycetota bacterium]